MATGTNGLNMGVDTLDEALSEFSALPAAGADPLPLIGQSASSSQTTSPIASAGVLSLASYDAETPLIASPAVATQADASQPTVTPVSWLSSAKALLNGANGEAGWLGARGATLVAGLGILIVGLTMLRPVQQAFSAAASAAAKGAVA